MRLPRIRKPVMASEPRLIEESVVSIPDEGPIIGLLPNDIALREEGYRLTPQNRYVITVHKGIDTLHVNALEQCNLDDADLLQTVDRVSAEALLRAGLVRSCWHCVPIPQG